MLLILAQLIGCGPTRRSTAGGDIVTPASGETPALREVAVAGLPELRDSLPPLDGGRVEAAAPVGWRVASRMSGFLTRFYVAKDGELPLLWITVAEADAGEPESVTRQNGAEFARKLKPQIVPDPPSAQRTENVSTTATPPPASDGANTEKTNAEKPNAETGPSPPAAASQPAPAYILIEPVEAIALGDCVWARYVVKGEENGSPLERQMLVTTRAGRRYTIELRVAPGALPQHRDAAYATAAGMKFVEGAREFLEPEPAPAQDAPAEDAEM